MKLEYESTNIYWACKCVSGMVKSTEYTGGNKADKIPCPKVSYIVVQKTINKIQKWNVPYVSNKC